MLLLELYFLPDECMLCSMPVDHIRLRAVISFLLIVENLGWSSFDV